MALSLLAGPANAGKVALLLERYLAALESDPILIVPNRPDVDRAERELLVRTGALVGGSIGTFDDLFERIARGNGTHRAVITSAQRTLLVHLERCLFREDGPQRPPELDGSVRFLEGAGLRGTLELVADEVLALLRDGVPPDEIAVICPSLERWRAPLDTAFTTLGVQYALEGRVRLGQTPFGQALLSLLRYAWLDGERRELFAFLRSPYSGLTRAHVDFLEGRLRGRGVTVPARVEEEIAKLRGQPLPHLGAVRDADDPLAALKSLARAMARAAYGLEAPPTHEAAQLDLRAHEAAAKLVAELEGWHDLGGEVAREEIVALLADAPVRLGAAGEAGRVAVLDLLRARTRRFEVVFLVG